METKSQREKEFLAMLEQHKRVIYKVWRNDVGVRLNRIREKLKSMSNQ